MKNLDNTLQNLTNSGLEQVSYKKGDVIYQFNENPKFAYFIYTGSVNIVSKNGSLEFISYKDQFGTDTQINFVNIRLNDELDKKIYDYNKETILVILN